MAEWNLRRAAVAVGALAGSAAFVAALIVLRSHEEAREELPTGRTSLERQETEAPASMASVETRIAPATRRRTFTLMVHWSGGAPAAGLDAEIMPLDAAQPFQRLRHVETDAAGRIVLEDPPERLELRIPREWARAEAKEHEWRVATRRGQVIETLGKTECTITLPGGADVTFRAIDASGAAVAGACLFVGNRRIGDPSAPLGCTGPDGGLEVRSLPAGAEVFATHGAWTSEPVGDERWTDEPVELRLDRPGVEVVGIVLDAEGAPAARARVRLWCGDVREVNADLFSYTAADLGQVGRFRLTVPCERWRLAADLHDHALTVLEAGGDGPLEVRLGPGFTLTGFVADAGGRALQKASVEAANVDEMWFLGAYYDLVCSVSEEAQGRYELRHASEGRVTFRASGRTASGLHGAATTSLTGRHEDRLSWDPRLETGLVVSGLALDEEGAPLAKALLRAESEDPLRGEPRATNTDLEGRFRLAGLEEVPYTLYSYRPGEGNLAGWLGRVQGVLPPAAEVIVRASSHLETGSLKGSFDPSIPWEDPP